jgi:hypothetical protein
VNHRKGYLTVAEAMRSKAAGIPGASIEEGCRCGLVHVRLPRPAGPVRMPDAPVSGDPATGTLLSSLSDYTRARIEIQPNGCWHWTGSIDSRGYGVANLQDGKRDAAHRHVYKQVHGSIPGSLHLDHQCHNRDAGCAGGSPCLHRRCVNPWHVEPATPQENVRRGKTEPALNLAKETCPKGHTYSHVDQNGWRKCKTCIDEKAVAKRRAAGIPERKLWQSHCKHGHELTPETTRWSKGNRYRKACDAEKERPEKRKPCRGCGGPKDPGRAYAYCAKCRSERVPKKGGRKDTGPPAKTRKAVYERDGWCCVCRGTPIVGRPHSVGHRKRRSQGGSNAPSNLLTFLGLGINSLDPDDHHARIDSRRDPEDEAKGYTVRSWDDPALVPVMVFSGHGSGLTAWLAGDGTYACEPPAGAAA